MIRSAGFAVAPTVRHPFLGRLVRSSWVVSMAIPNAARTALAQRLAQREGLFAPLVIFVVYIS
jgi:hypothetical protein